MRSIRLPLTTFVVGVLAFSSFLVDPLCHSANGEPPPAEVIAKLKEGQASFQNAVAVTQWEEVWDGKPKSWERQRWTWDSLGRRRLSYQYGLIDESGRELPPEEDLEISNLFDGEIVVDERFYPHRDRQGGNDDKLPKGYRAAIVSDAAAPARQALESHRNPLEYLRNAAMRELEQCQAQKVPITVREADGQLELSYALPRTDSNSIAVRSTVRVDPKRGWSLTRWTAFDSADKPTSEISVTINESNGRWMATEGSHKNWADRPTDSAPIFDWRFKVTEFTLNDPDFKDDVFAVRLPPDTAVSDTRFKAVYRIGAEAASADSLSKLAEMARAEEAAKPAFPSSVPEQPRRRVGLLLIFNLIAIAAATVFFVLQHRKRRGHK